MRFTRYISVQRGKTICVHPDGTQIHRRKGGLGEGDNTDGVVVQAVDGTAMFVGDQRNKYFAWVIEQDELGTFEAVEIPSEKEAEFDIKADKLLPRSVK